MTARELPHDLPNGDHEIVALMRAGQPRGLEALLLVHGGVVKGLLGAAFRRAEGDHALEDAVCDACRTLFQRARKLDPDQNLAGYLYVTARRKLLRVLKRERHWHKPLWDGAEEQIAADSTTHGNSDRLSERVRRAIDGLPLSEREILGIDMAYDFQIAAHDVARILGTTRETVFAQRHRTKLKLQQLLSPDPQKRGQQGTHR